ncbi:MAG: hypothetical protein ACEQSB_02940 [Undibacterium sp.]
MSTALPNETAFFRCVAAISLQRPPKDVNPHLYFEGLERRRFRLSPGFKTGVQPNFNPEGKGDPGGPPLMVYVWQLKTERPYALAIKNWPGQQKVPWHFFDELVAMETDLFVPVLPRDGQHTLLPFTSSPQTLVAGGSTQIGSPVLSIVRLHFDRTGSRPVWDIRSEDRVASMDPCSVNHRFLSC